jgi:hypothetical protein
MGRLIPIAPNFKIEDQKTGPPVQMSRVVHLADKDGVPLSNMSGLVIVNEPASAPAVKNDAFIRPSNIIYQIVGDLNSASYDNPEKPHRNQPFKMRHRPASDRVVMSIDADPNQSFWTFDEFEEFVHGLKHDVYISEFQFAQLNVKSSTVTLYTTSMIDHANLTARIRSPRKPPLKFDIDENELGELAEWCTKNLLGMFDLEVSNWGPVRNAYLRVKDDVEEVHAKLRWCGN